LKRGIVRTEDGEELLFEAAQDPDAIQGDDLVEIVVTGNGAQTQAKVTRVIEKATSRPCNRDQVMRALFGDARVSRTA
jgi:hypothetical protein